MGCRELRIDFIVREVMLVLDSAQVDLVVIEAYAHGRVTSATTLGELGGVLRRALWLREQPWTAVVSSSVKKHATGSGKASKQDMITAALPYWPVVCDDEADALHLMRYGCSHYDELTTS
jgi:Holliday junction resolvasome RuvABC endonuclease subunit